MKTRLFLTWCLIFSAYAAIVAPALAAIGTSSAFQILQAGTNASDTLNGGGFNPANANFMTDLACDANTGTIATPVVSSSSYNFVAGDINHWLYIQSGTGFTSDQYVQIGSVSANKAYLNAGVGSVIIHLLPNVTYNTAVGVGTTATPSSGKFAIDYSQQDASIAFSDGTTNTGSGTTQIRSATLTKAMTGNLVRISAGTNATTGLYEIVTGGTGTALLDRNWNSSTVSGGTGGLGPNKTPGLMATVLAAGVASYSVSVNGTGTMTTTTAGAGGPITLNQVGVTFEGFTTKRGDGGYATLSAGALTTFTMATASSTFNRQNIFRNLVLNGNSGNAVKGMLATSGIANQNSIWVVKCQFLNCKNIGFDGGSNLPNAIATYSNSIPNGFKNVNTTGCISQSASQHGFLDTTGDVSHSFSGAISSGSVGFYTFADNRITNCWTYGSGSHGFNSQFDNIHYLNCLSVSDTGYGFTADNGGRPIMLAYCAAYNTGSGNYNTGLSYPAMFIVGTFTSLTGVPFTNAAGGDFSLNAASGQGALLRGLGFPGTFPGISTTGYIDIGGVQHRDTPGGGANLRGGFQN